MKTSITPKFRYVRYLHPEEMHENTTLWLSELNFLRDEQLFLNRLVERYTTDLLEEEVFARRKTLIGRLFDIERDLTVLRDQVRKHHGQIEILIDRVDQLTMEKAYRKTHKELARQMHEYRKDYRVIKDELFQLVSGTLRDQKKKPLSP